MLPLVDVHFFSILAHAEYEDLDYTAAALLIILHSTIYHIQTVKLKNCFIEIEGD